jgi:hypothetical protein
MTVMSFLDRGFTQKTQIFKLSKNKLNNPDIPINARPLDDQSQGKGPHRE